MKEKKYRLLHIIPNLRPGGAERMVANLITAIDKERFEAAAISLYPKSGTILDKELEEKGFHVYYLSKHLGMDVRMFRQIYRVFRDYQPDIVHTHLSVLRYSLLPAILCQIPARVHTVHSIAQKEVDSIGKLIHLVAFRFANVVPVGISQEISTTIREVYGSAIQPPVIYNGVPTFLFNNASRTTPLEEGNLILLHVGSFSPPKNHDMLLGAFELAVKEYNNLRLWLVGEGPLIDRIKNRVLETGLSNHVFFLGVRDDIPSLLASSDIFVLSSDWEGMPLVVIEAMAAGKPVIATCVGAIPEMVTDGTTGILVPARDKQALARAILHLARNNKERQRLGETAKGRAFEEFDISRAAREYEALYLRILEKQGRAYRSTKR